MNSIPPAQSTTQNTNLVFSSGVGNAMSIADFDAGSNDVKVTLTATNGTVTLAGTVGLTITAGSDGSATVAFTGAISAINTALNGLTFAPASGFIGAASLEIVTDDEGNTGSGGAQTDSDTIAITVTAAGNAAPVLAINTGLALAQGATATISSAQLRTTDVDNSTAQLTYTIGSIPTGGSLKRNGTELAVNDTFTQADIDANLITYSAGAATSSDSFTFTVSDGASGTIPSTTFSITVLPSVRLNEIFVNPPGTDDNREYIELLSASGNAALTGIWLLEIEGDVTNARTIDNAVNLGAATTGANGLLLIGSK